ncbi:MAG: phage holin family protein [Pseudomonadota bacterium]|nr:phage holin family protein [Pseudomonadota bacterium]
MNSSAYLASFLPFLAWLKANPFIGLLLLLMIGDTITGVLCAIRYKRLDSSIGREGLTRKAGTLVIVLLLLVLQSLEISTLPVAETVATGFCGVESISLFENCDQLGIRVPYLRDYFRKLHVDGDAR